MRLKTYCDFFCRAPAFFLKCTSLFSRQKHHCKILILTRGEVFVAKVWACSFAVPVFSHYSILEFGRGAYNLVFAPGITRPLHAPALKRWVKAFLQVAWNHLRVSCAVSPPQPHCNSGFVTFISKTKLFS